MLCDNCKKREANVKYSENINGRRKEMNLCEECSQKLGIGKMDFSLPIDFSSFFGSFMDDFATSEFMPMLKELKTLRCNSCGNTFDEIANTGRLGCKDCYEVFEERLNPIIKKVQGADRHVGRIGKIIDQKIENKNQSQKEIKKNLENKEVSQIEILKEDLKVAIQEERYEEAAKIRDEIKKLEK